MVKPNKYVLFLVSGELEETEAISKHCTGTIINLENHKLVLTG